MEIEVVSQATSHSTSMNIDEELVDLSINNSDIEKFDNIPDINFQQNLFVEGDSIIDSIKSAFVANLKLNTKLTAANVTFVLNSVNTLMNTISDFYQSEVKKFLFSERMNIDNENAKLLLHKFSHRWEFQKFQSPERQMNALKNNFQFVDPETIKLGNRIDQVLNPNDQEYEKRVSTESCQYVPITKVLQLLLSNPFIKEHVDEQPIPSYDGTLNSYIDGDNFKNHVFFQKYTNAIRIQLYYDDIVVNNALGTKTVPHKLGMFYYTIGNIPHYMNSSLGGIHILSICTTADVNKYGFHKILEPFLNELKILESDAGVEIDLNGQPYILRASISSVIADGAAAHLLFGLLSPSAKLFCRMCTISRAQFCDDPRSIHKNFQLRTKDLHAQHLAAVNRKKDMKKLTGVSEESALHASK